MERTRDFEKALRRAYESKKYAEGNSTSVVKRLLAHPVVQTPTGEVIWAMRRAHVVVRRLYLQQNGLPLRLQIDWSTIVDWLIEHWDDIARAILSVLPFLI